MRVSQRGIDLIKKFEGIRLKSYVCPAGVLTIGYGHTGSDVTPNMQITEQEAERLLWKDTESAQQAVSSFVSARLNQNEYDALVSFTFNIGSTAFVNSTLLRLLNHGAERDIVAGEFMRWVKAGSNEAVPGLVRRREAEKALFLEKVKHPMLGKSILAKRDTWLKRRPVDSNSLAAEEKLFVPKGSAWQWTEIRMFSGETHQRVFLEAQPDKEWWIFPDHWKIINDTEPQEGPPKLDGEIKLVVPFFSQRDNKKDPMRTCFSSSCAMLLATLDPDAIEGDDEYINEVFKYGDTTSAAAQLDALKHFGVDARFVQNADWALVESQLKKSIPVPMGVLHKGPVSNPTGGGHWICCVGITADKTKLWVHDPFGEMDLISGGYVSTDGKYRLYSKKNLGPRFLVEGSKSGWIILAE
jgi:GH24 family phage-related lysozyme (muramidase)